MVVRPRLFTARTACEAVLKRGVARGDCRNAACAPFRIICRPQVCCSAQLRSVFFQLERKLGKRPEFARDRALHPIPGP